MLVGTAMTGQWTSLPTTLGSAPSIPATTTTIRACKSIGYGANFCGVAPLLTMLNSCAFGVGVVNINNGFSAGLLAHRINMVTDE